MSDMTSINGLEVEDVNIIKNINTNIFSTGFVKRKTLHSFIRDVMKEPTQDNFIKGVNEFTENDLMGVLNLVYRKNSASHFNSSPNALLDATVVFICIRTLIKKWDGFPKLFTKKATEKHILNELRKYLKYNLKYVMIKKDEIIENLKKDDPEVDKIKEFEQYSEEDGEKLGQDANINVDEDLGKCDVIKIECPYNRLKTLVVMNTGYEDTTFINDADEDKTTSTSIPFQLSEFSFTSMFNWSFVGVTLNTPEYSITYNNVHELDHSLVRFTKNYKPDIIKKSHNISRVPLGVNLETCLVSRDLVKYLHMSCKSPENNSTCSSNLNKTLTELISVIYKVGSLIKTSTEYTIPAKNSYVRYLGLAKKFRSGGPIISIEKQKHIEDNAELNVRLQETIWPRARFCIFKLNKSNEDNKSTIFFNCTLCNVSFGDGRAEINLKNHLILEHGQEPDWLCNECEESFTMKKLTIKGWAHVCTGKPKPITMNNLNKI